MGGLHALRRNLCHIASSHLIQDDEAEYNFEYAFSELTQMPAVINFCRREQGILIQKDNPKQISKVDDFARKGIQIVNRSLGTGTRLLLDRQLKHAGINGNKIDGYAHEVSRHLDVGLEVISGRADAGLGIRTVADLLDLDFIPLLWERYDLLVAKDRFFNEDVQRFIGLLHEKQFFELAKTLKGYDLSSSGKMIFPQDQKKGEGKRNNT
jgi:putative molybdopterin biosynthesis protein